MTVQLPENHRDANRPASAGVVVLMSVIIIGALLLVIGLSAAYRGQTELIMASDASREQEVRYVAVACVEEALFRLKKDPAYLGGTVVVGAETCTVTVSGSGTARTVVSTATVADYTKTLNLAVSSRVNAAGKTLGWHVDSFTEVTP